MSRKPIEQVSLLTDFGTSDGYVGVMKGVMTTVFPNCRFIDIAHDLPPQDVKSAAFLLEHSYPYFPEGTVHLTVVDPGVGSDRRGLAVASKGHFFVGPDNGLFSPVLAGARVHSLENSKYWLPKQSNTFHGRDIFSPVAAHLASGVPIEELGPRIEDPIVWEDRSPMEEGVGRWMGKVVYVDRFGNLVTNFTLEWMRERGIDPWGDSACLFGKTKWPLAATYSDVSPGERCAVVGGFACLELSINQGNAANDCGATIGAAVRLEV